MHNFFPHTRKRPPTKVIRLLDKIVMLFSFLLPLSTIPQIIEILLAKSAENISMLTWSFWLLCSAIWLFYGLIHRIKPIIVVNFLWVIVDIIMISLIVIY